MIKEQDLLEKTIQKIDDIARERMQANITLNLAQQRLISDPADLKIALNSIKKDIDLYIKIKLYAQQILQTSPNKKRQVLIDKLRETVRLSYEYEKKFYNRNSCKFIEYPYMHNLFNLLQPFISHTQKNVENAMQLSIKLGFCGYKLDYMDTFLDISTFLKEYKTYLRKLNSNPTYSNLTQQLFLQLQSIIKVINNPQTMSELYDNVYEFCQIQNIFYDMLEYFSSEQDPEPQEEKKPEPESKRKTKQTATCTQKETIAQDSKDVPPAEPEELSLPTTNTTTSTVEDNSFNLIWKQRRLDSIARLLHRQLFRQRVTTGTVAILLSNNKQEEPCFIIATKMIEVNSASVREALSQLVNETKILLAQVESENEDFKLESYIKYKRDQLKKLLIKLITPNCNNYSIKTENFYRQRAAVRNLRYDIDLAKLTQTIHNYVGNNKYLPDIDAAFKTAFLLLINKKKGTHPELAIVNYIAKQNISREKFNYIGLNMLNCCQCHALIHGTNNTSHANRIISFNDQSTIPVYTRGFFNYRYPNYVLPLWSIKINHLQSEHDLKEQVDGLGIPIENVDLKELLLAQNADLSDSETEISRCTI